MNLSVEHSNTIVSIRMKHDPGYTFTYANSIILEVDLFKSSHPYCYHFDKVLIVIHTENTGSKDFQLNIVVFHRLMKLRRPFQPTSLVVRTLFVMMWVGGMSIRAIARATGTSATTVNRWIKRWQQEGTINTRPRPGRPSSFQFFNLQKNRVAF